MNKFFIFLLSCFLFISCASIPKMTPEEKQIQKEYEDAEEPTFNIKWDTTYIDPSEGLDGYLEIKNPKTGTIVRITYKDFFIMKRAYKNWRSIENGTPVITNVEESGQYIVVTFNYFDNESKSILSGQFIVNTKYIKDKKDQQDLAKWKAISWGAFTYGGLVTIIAIIFILI